VIGGSGDCAIEEAIFNRVFAQSPNHPIAQSLNLTKGTDVNNQIVHSDSRPSLA